MKGLLALGIIGVGAWAAYNYEQTSAAVAALPLMDPSQAHAPGSCGTPGCDGVTKAMHDGTAVPETSPAWYQELANSLPGATGGSVGLPGPVAQLGYTEGTFASPGLGWLGG